MMATLDEVRRQHPVEDQAVYDRAYAEADLAGRLAEIVYRLRSAAGLTQTELARRMGTTQSAIARVESGGSTPTLDLLDRVGRAVGAEITLTVSGEAVHFGATAA
jgi:ribosome-binding protein aMBF1 (putative translation factor)